MAIGKILKSLFGGESKPSEPKELQCDAFDYNGFKIEPAPIVEFIRADQNGDQQVSIDHSISKAKQIVDELGQKLLSRQHL
jgi:hypothetical protein